MSSGVAWSTENLLCYTDTGFAGHISKHRRYPEWITEVQHIRGGIALIILYLYQNAEEGLCMEKQKEIWWRLLKNYAK